MNEIEHYYQALGLQPEATEAEVREAYRDLVKVWHPDRFSGDPHLQEKAQEKLKEIDLAYKWVLDYVAAQIEPELEATAEEEPSTHYEHDHPGSIPPTTPSDPRRSKVPTQGFTDAEVAEIAKRQKVLIWLILLSLGGVILISSVPRLLFVSVVIGIQYCPNVNQTNSIDYRPQGPVFRS